MCLCVCVQRLATVTAVIILTPCTMGLGSGRLGTQRTYKTGNKRETRWYCTVLSTEGLGYCGLGTMAVSWETWDLGKRHRKIRGKNKGGARSKLGGKSTAYCASMKPVLIRSSSVYQASPVTSSFQVPVSLGGVATPSSLLSASWVTTHSPLTAVQPHSASQHFSP